MSTKQNARYGGRGQVLNLVYLSGKPTPCVTPSDRLLPGPRRAS